MFLGGVVSLPMESHSQILREAPHVLYVPVLFCFFVFSNSPTSVARPRALDSYSALEALMRSIVLSLFWKVVTRRGVPKGPFISSTRS